MGDAVPWSLNGDFNHDGSVDVVDLLTFVDSFGLCSGDPGYNPFCDLNCDGCVDVEDLLGFIPLFGNPAS